MHPARAVVVAWLVVVVVVAVVLAAAAAVALQATDAGLRRALCLLMNAQREEESRTLRERE